MDGRGNTYSDGGESRVPTQGGRSRPMCDDCGHNGHFLNECKVCGCPPGKERKRERDEELSMEHGDSSRPAEGFY